MSWPRRRSWTPSYNPVPYSSDEERIEFNSWGEYLTHCTRIPSSPRVMSIHNSHSFTNTDSYEAAMSLASEGWHDAEADARKLSNALVRQVGSMVERDEELYDVEGYGVDISLYNQGTPECWMRNEQRYDQAPGPIVKIVYNAVASGGVNNKILIARGAAVAGLIECIELSGRSVELWMVIGISHIVQLRVKVKEAGQPLDMGRVMFALAHPSSLRRLGFRVIELSQHNYLTTQSYGMPSDLSDKNDKGDLYIPMAMYGDYQWTEESYARNWIIEKLREQNVQVNDATTEKD